MKNWKCSLIVCMCICTVYTYGFWTPGFQKFDQQPDYKEVKKVSKMSYGEINGSSISKFDIKILTLCL